MRLALGIMGALDTFFFVVDFLRLSYTVLDFNLLLLVIHFLNVVLVSLPNVVAFFIFMIIKKYNPLFA